MVIILRIIFIIGVVVVIIFMMVVFIVIVVVCRVMKIGRIKLRVVIKFLIMIINCLIGFERLENYVVIVWSKFVNIFKIGVRVVVIVFFILVIVNFVVFWVVVNWLIGLSVFL